MLFQNVVRQCLRLSMISLLGSGALLVASAVSIVPANAQFQNNAKYLRFGGGFSYNQGITNSYTFPTAGPTETNVSASAEYHTKFGFALDAGAGFSVNNWRFDVGANYTTNKSDTLSAGTIINAKGAEISGQFNSLDIMANFIYNPAFSINVAQPYFGIGLGYLFNFPKELRAEQVVSTTDATTGVVSSAKRSISYQNIDDAFAAQFIVGLTSKLSEKVAMYGDYRFLMTVNKLDNPITYKDGGFAEASLAPTKSSRYFRQTVNFGLIIGF